MTPMTLTEKILARHAGRDAVQPGDNIWVDVDVLMTHDVCGPGTIGIFKQHFGKDAKVWDRHKVVVVPDHYIVTADKMANRNVDVLRQFVREQNLPYYYDVGTDQYKGVCHIALPEEGHLPRRRTPPKGSTSSLPGSRAAIAFTVKSRLARSSASERRRAGSSAQSTCT